MRIFLRQTLAANRIPAEVVEKALWSREGSLYFHPHVSYTGIVNETPSDYPIEAIKVNAPDGCWLKLDIEGAEYEITAATHRSRCRPAVISMEIHYANQRGARLLDILKNAGYEIHGDWGPTTRAERLRLCSARFRSESQAQNSGVRILRPRRSCGTRLPSDARAGESWGRYRGWVCRESV